MKNELKSFTVITAAYNMQDYIERCVEGIVKANYDLSKIEHIIVDDGSTDKTKEICEKLASKYKHIKFYSKSNGNWGSVINYIKQNKLAHNDYITICDADDMLLPNAFFIVNEKNEEADIVSTCFIRLKKGKKLRVPSYFYLCKRRFHKKYDWHYFSNLTLPQTGWIKKEIFYQIPNLKENCSNQDIPLFIWANFKSKFIRFISKSTFLYSASRKGNSRSESCKDEGIRKLVQSNFRDYEEKKWLTPFFLLAFGFGHSRKYFKKNNLKFDFTGAKLELTGFPFYIRPFLRLFYLMFVKKFVVKKK